MNSKARTIIAFAAPVAILAMLLIVVTPPSAHNHAPADEFVPDGTIEPLHADPYHDDARRRGILIPKRVKEILSYHKTALA